MRALKFWLLALALASPAAFALSGNTVATDNVKARLVSEVAAVGPGQTFWVALDFRATQSKGVYVSFDTSTRGEDSRVGLPGARTSKVTFGGDWMIQAILGK